MVKSTRSKSSIKILGILLILGSIIIGSIAISNILKSSEKRRHTDYKLFLFFNIENCGSPNPFSGFKLKLYILGNFSINSSTQNHYFISHFEYYEIYNESGFSWNISEINKSYIQEHSSQYVTFINYTVSGEIYQKEDPSQYCIVNFSLWLWANGTWGCHNPIYDQLGSQWCVKVNRDLTTKI